MPAAWPAHIQERGKENHPMINKVILVGRLGKDPEIRATPQGTPVAKFTVATDEKFTDRAGEKQERTEWHNITAWGKLGEICGQYLKKGKLVYIEGSIRTDSWDDKESGQKKYRTEIVANTMKMLDRRGDEGGSSSGGGYSGGYNQSSSSSARPSGGRPSAAPDMGPDDDEDVPF
jgi:single-strand DNA-binding protein